MNVVDMPQSKYANAKRPTDTQLAEDNELASEAQNPAAEAGTEHKTSPGEHAAADNPDNAERSIAGDGDVSSTSTSPIATKATAGKPRFGSRRVLYATAAMVVLAGVGIATVAWEVTKGPSQPAPPSEVGVGTAPPAPLIAPSAQIARMQAPAVAHFDDTRPTHPSGESDQLQEMMAARKTGTPISLPVVVAQAPSAFPEPSTAAARPTVVVPAPPVVAVKVVEPTTPRTPAVTPLPVVLPPAVAVANQDAADQAARLQAAPMTPAQEVSVLHLVTEEANMIRFQRQELADLHAEQGRLTERVDNTLADFGRRLEMAEATRAVADADSPQPSAPPVLRRVENVRHVMPPVAGPLLEPSDSPHQYRVQAASPHLAMLADVDQPQEAEGLAVSVGDTVPGFGHVTAISQRGTQWVVKTDHGVIQ